MTFRMDGTFLAKLALSFVVGGLWVSASTAAADRTGPKIGGWIGGLPSTVAVALFFIGLIQGPRTAADAAVMIPFMAGVNGLFLAVYVVASRRAFWSGFGLASAVWAFLAAATILLKTSRLAFSLAAYAVFFAASALILRRERPPDLPPGKAPAFSGRALAGRALLSGSIIATAVALAKAAGPMYGGIFAAFPGVFASTVLITYRSRGLNFSRSIARPMMTSGFVNVTVYALAVRVTYPSLGLAAGTVSAYAAALVTAYAVYRVTSRSS